MNNAYQGIGHRAVEKPDIHRHRRLLRARRERPRRCRAAEQRDELAPVAVGTPVTWAPPAQIRTCSFPAYGSYLGYQRQMLAVCAPAPVTRLPGSASGACFAGPHSPWSPPFAPLAPQRIAPRCSPASQLLWRSPTSRARASSATAPRLPDADQNIFVAGQTRDIPGSDAIRLRVMWPSTPAGRQCLA